MSMRLIILGLLINGEKHPYEIQHLMKIKKMDKYIKFQKGSLYYAVEQLQKSGFIEVTDIIRDTNRPDKTIYRITEKGREEFNKLLLEQFSFVDYFFHPMYAALLFAQYGDNEKIAAVLDDRIKKVEIGLARMQKVYEEHLTFVPRSILYIMSGTVEHIKTELKWLKGLRQDVVKGRLKEVGTPIEYGEN